MLTVFFLLANVFIDVLLNGTLFPAGAYVQYLFADGNLTYMDITELQLSQE